MDAIYIAIGMIVFWLSLLIVVSFTVAAVFRISVTLFKQTHLYDLVLLIESSYRFAHDDIKKYDLAMVRHMIAVMDDPTHRLNKSPLKKQWLNEFHKLERRIIRETNTKF